MLRVDFVTLFPDMVLQAVGHSILRRASEAGLVEFRTSDPRAFSTDKHRTVDDKPFGGGAGMLMMAEPVALAIESLAPFLASRVRRTTDREEITMPAGRMPALPATPKPPTHVGKMPALPAASPSRVAVVFTDPTGPRFEQDDARELSEMEQVVFVCGHYEGIDDRVREAFATHVFSIGDFVLTNGELPALVMADAVVRLLPGALGSPESLEQDSHNGGLLSAPQYTRPEVWRGMAVPEVVKAGDHAKLARWKREQALRLTRERRPDLFASAELRAADLEALAGPP